MIMKELHTVSKLSHQSVSSGLIEIEPSFTQGVRDFKLVESPISICIKLFECSLH